MPDPTFVTAPDGTQIACRHQPGATPTIAFLPGYNSDMAGAKANHLAAHCAAAGRAFLRLDYSGHGASGGRFIDGSIGRWRDDALAVLATTTGPLILAGSSMGGWIALLAALCLPTRVAGLLLIAPAPDFTQALMWDPMPERDRAFLLRRGTLPVPSQYGPPLVITRTLIEDGRTHLLLHAPIELAIPARIVHGQQDADVPWQRSLTLADRLASPDVRLTLIKDGDHRLSRPADLAAIASALDELALAVQDRA